MVLDEIFGVTEQFGEQVEADLKAFRQLRDETLRNSSPENRAALQRMADNLAAQSFHLQQIMGMEMRQVNRQLQAKITA